MSAPPFLGVLYNFCFIKFSQKCMVEAVGALRALLFDPEHQGEVESKFLFHYYLLPDPRYTHAEFHWDWSRGGGAYKQNTNTQILPFIY